MTTQTARAEERTGENNSLPETHCSIPIPKTGGRWKRYLAFAGPAFLISVGYMDPGNWATDIEGGSRFRYQLLWVILASNFIALLLQTLSARLGLVTGRDLPQMCRESFKKARCHYALDSGGSGDCGLRFSGSVWAAPLR